MVRPHMVTKDPQGAQGKKPNKQTEAIIIGDNTLDREKEAQQLLLIKTTY